MLEILRSHTGLGSRRVECLGLSGSFGRSGLRVEGFRVPKTMQQLAEFGLGFRAV